jgi:hydroxyacylglutathione hydrolase
MKLKVEQIRVGPMQNFQYLLKDEESRESMAIDSGWETAPIVEAARRAEMKVKYVVATHGHFDHSQTLRALAKELGDAAVVAHESSAIDHDLSVKGGDVLRLGKAEVRVLHTPGHTEDSICLYDSADLFTGDTLFIGNCGRTDLPGGSAKALYESLHGVIMALPRETMIYPGHDYGEAPARRLGEEMRTNPTLLARNLNEFIGLP